MKLSLAEPGYLKDSISIISELVNEARFKVTPDALELVAMDPANVAMVVFKLLSSSFTEYDVKGDTEISVNLSNLKQILKRAGASDMITLELSSDSQLKIQFKGKSTRTFSVPLIDIEEKEQKVPDLNFDVTVNTASEVLNSAIEDADVVAESVTLIGEKDKLTINAEGDLSKAKIEIKADEETKIDATADPVKAKYSIEYLKKIINGSKIASSVSINFSKDYPLKISYTEVDKVQLAFILAPRVEND